MFQKDKFCFANYLNYNYFVYLPRGILFVQHTKFNMIFMLLNLFDNLSNLSNLYKNAILLALFR